MNGKGSVTVKTRVFSGVIVVDAEIIRTGNERKNMTTDLVEIRIIYDKVIW